MAKTKTTTPNFDILEFKDKCSERILKKGHVNANGIMQYQDNGWYLDLNFLLKNPYWEIHKVKILTKGYEDTYSINSNFHNKNIACFELKGVDLLIRLSGGGTSVVYGAKLVSNIELTRETKTPKIEKAEPKRTVILITEDGVDVLDNYAGFLDCVSKDGNSYKRTLDRLPHARHNGNVKIFYCQQKAKDYVLPKRKATFTLEEVIEAINKEAHDVGKLSIDKGYYGPKLKKLFESKVNIKFN